MIFVLNDKVLLTVSRDYDFQRCKTFSIIADDTLISSVELNTDVSDMIINEELLIKRELRIIIEKELRILRRVRIAKYVSALCVNFFNLQTLQDSHFK